MEVAWTIEDALRLIRIIQPKAKGFNYHIALGGGVLNVGMSNKDLDLYFLAMDNTGETKIEELVKWLEEMWGPGKNIGRDYGHEGQGSLFNDAPQRLLAQIPWEGGGNWIQGIERATNPFWRNQAITTGTVEVKVPENAVVKPRESPYTRKLKFMRGGEEGDRIDVFIIG